MTDHGDPDHWLLPPDPDRAPGFPAWPAPARRRLALCALADRLDDIVGRGGTARVVLVPGTRAAWRGLASWLRAAGLPTVVTGEAPEEVPERLEMPADESAARRGRHGLTMLGPSGTAVRPLGMTVAGAPEGTSATGPWTVVSDEGWRTELVRPALLDPIRELRAGQRLQAIVTSGNPGTGPRVVSAWP